MRKLAFAFTQLHLINLINMRTSLYKDDDMDLIAFSPSCTGALDVLERLEEREVFNRVLVLENYYPNAKGINKIYYRLKELITAKKNKCKISQFVKDFKYDEFFSYGSNMEAYITYSEISRENDVSFVVYEEGIGTYWHKLSNVLRPWHTATLKILGVSIPDLPNRLMVYVPELLVIDIPESVEVVNIPKLKCKDLINELWNYKPTNKFGPYNTICFEQPVKNSAFQAELFRHFDRKTTVVKMHPRSPYSELYSDMNIMEKSGTIWEIECMNGDFSEKSLVSFFSTACLTPKMMFDCEPEVIFLEQLLHGEFNDDMFVSLVEKFRSIYSDSRRVRVPHSIDDL